MLRWVFPALTVGLVLSSIFPLWYTRMEAPQYKGDEALEVYVYVNRVEGDLHEIGVLNQYVGVTLPTDFEELRIAPWVLGVLITFSLVASVVRGRRRRWASVMVFGGFLAASIAGAIALSQRLQTLGHERGPSVFARMEDFDPPFLGTAKIANFVVHTGLGVGGWAFAFAFILAALGVWVAFRREGAA